MITKRGKAFARLLNPYIGTTKAILETCSLIARYATTHHRLQELACNAELTEAENELDRTLEARIKLLVATLPTYKGKPITVRFDGDPRGYTVKLVVLDEPHVGNTWGLGGEFGI